jgi:hypothetical protein
LPENLISRRLRYEFSGQVSVLLAVSTLTEV